MRNSSLASPETSGVVIAGEGDKGTAHTPDGTKISEYQISDTGCLYELALLEIS